MANDINGSLRNVLPGNIDYWNRIYATVADANAAIPSTVVGGRNFREGKVVQIGTEVDHKEHRWVGGFGDSNLLPYLETNSDIEVSEKNIAGIEYQITDEAGTVLLERLTSGLTRFPGGLADIPEGITDVEFYNEDIPGVALRVVDEFGNPGFDIPDTGLTPGGGGPDTSEDLEFENFAQEVNRLIEPNPFDVVEGEDDDLLRGNIVLNHSSACQTGATFKQLSKQRTPLVYGVNNTGVSVQFRKSSNLPVRGIKYMGAYSVPSSVNEVSEINQFSLPTSNPPQASPSMGTFALVGYNGSVPAGYTYNGTQYKRGDIIIYNGSSWVKKTSPSLPDNENINWLMWWRVTTAGTFNRISYAIGDIIYCSGLYRTAIFSKAKEGEWFFRAEFNPNSFVLPLDAGNQEFYIASEAGTYAGKTYKEGDYLLIFNGQGVKFTCEEIQTVPDGEFFNFSVQNAGDIEWRLSNKENKGYKETTRSLPYYARSTFYMSKTNSDLYCVGNSHAGNEAFSGLLQSFFPKRKLSKYSYGGATSWEIYSQMLSGVRQGFGFGANADILRGSSFLFVNDTNNITDLGQCKEFAWEFKNFMGAYPGKYCFISAPGDKVVKWKAALNRFESTNRQELFDMEEFYAKAFPYNWYNWRKALLELSLLSNLPDLQHPGKTESQVASQYGMVALSFHIDYAALGINPSALNFLGYRASDSTSDLPTGGNNNDYYVRNGTNTQVAGSFDIKINGVWQHVGYDRAHPRSMQIMADKFYNEFLKPHNF